MRDGGAMEAWRDYVPDLTSALPFLAGDSAFRRLLRSLAGKLTALEMGGKLLHKAHQMNPRRANLFADIAEVCRLQVDGEGDLPTGPLVVVANHPTGPMDGISYGSWLLDRRPDALILTNGALARIPSFEGRVIGLSLYDDARAASMNALALRRVLKHLHQGGCVAAFPAGTIGWRQSDGSVRDPEWMTTVFDIALRAKAPVACVKIIARNGPVLDRLLALHAHVRTFLLGWSFLYACGGRHVLKLCGVLENGSGGNSRQLADDARRLIEP
jgi:putative hemolysin